jgi:hypothetical protein
MQDEAFYLPAIHHGCAKNGKEVSSLQEVTIWHAFLVMEHQAMLNADVLNTSNMRQSHPLRWI